MKTKEELTHEYYEEEHLTQILGNEFFGYKDSFEEGFNYALHWMLYGDEEVDE